MVKPKFKVGDLLSYKGFYFDSGQVGLIIDIDFKKSENENRYLFKWFTCESCFHKWAYESDIEYVLQTNVRWTLFKT